MMGWGDPWFDGGVGKWVKEKNEAVQDFGSGVFWPSPNSKNRLRRFELTCPQGGGGSAWAEMEMLCFPGRGLAGES